jgi:hypothetical protein
MSDSSAPAKSSLEKAKFIVDILSGLAIPVVLFFVTISLSRQHDAEVKAQSDQESRARKQAEDKAHEDRDAQLLLGIGPYLFDGDPQKVQFGASILAFYKDLPQPLVVKLQSLNSSNNPLTADTAGHALAGSPVPELEAASPLPTPSPLVPPTPPPQVPATDRDRWYVFIKSGRNRDALDRDAEQINQNFRAKNINLTAKVTGPGPLAPDVSGIVVGADVPFEQARTSLALARQSGFPTAYMIRSPGAR